MSGREGNLRGLESEDLFEGLCKKWREKRRLPKRVVGFRRASLKEDRAGTDFFFEIRDGFEISVDVKCSDAAAKSYRKLKRRRGEDLSQKIMIVVNRERSEEGIRMELCKKLERMLTRACDELSARQAAAE